ncbi:Lymphocyte antigen 6E [Willisornis vidua]|uniref:Lymphocyte antigen 6E n=1 Tax=Willisornis vidua TaxID=1566151 RepID=A0ABQ9DMJ2_9PASS|nr:Lymphocyte antigen 6E [Willisornis vidua]
MKALLLAVLAAVLCVERAHTLICFSCSDASSNWACLTPVKCGENENHCVTTYVGVGLVYPFTGVSTVTKMCSSVCVPSDVDGIGMTRPVSCCYSDLCNADGATSLSISFVPVGMLASSLCAFFWTRP